MRKDSLVMYDDSLSISCICLVYSYGMKTSLMLYECRLYLLYSVKCICAYMYMYDDGIVLCQIDGCGCLACK